MNECDVIRCTRADIRRLVAFRAREAGTNAEEAEYGRWLYEAAADNGTLFRAEDFGTVNAHVSGHPAALHVLGHEVRALGLVGLFVARSGRRRGLGTRLVREVANSAPLAMAVDVSVEARSSFVRAGWKLLGNLPVYVRAADPGALLREKRRPGLGKALGAPLRTAMRGLSAVEAGVARMKGLRLEEVARFDGRCDGLWERVSAEHPIAVRRDAAYATRRFDSVRWHSYRRFELLRADALEGYAVVRREPRGGLQVGEIVDYLCPARSLRALLAACANKLSAEGCEAVYCVSQDARGEAAFKRAGFIRRDSGWPLFVHPNGLDPDLAQAALVRRNWFLTRADSNLDRPRLASGEEIFEDGPQLPDAAAQASSSSG